MCTPVLYLSLIIISIQTREYTHTHQHEERDETVFFYGTRRCKRSRQGSGNRSLQMPLHYPMYSKSDYEPCPNGSSISFCLNMTY
ncbi:hypothetical protein Dsin_013462 [Dipteronia sinensis]|uniref:Secreted protein n=1 Tax=Dipteronia sinensis TaxID=43782 RepID=A0AAE0AL66_9ROSI|nr:hypothetical protein Dsin_013462 [Dipteronia sinensis]